MLTWILLVAGVIAGVVLVALLPTDRPPRQDPESENGAD